MTTATCWATSNHFTPLCTTITNPAAATSLVNTQILQNKIGKLLGATRNVLLQPGADYALRNPAEYSSINTNLLLKHPQHYYEHADLEISTNGLFNEPANDFFKQRFWFDVRETLTK